MIERPSVSPAVRKERARPARRLKVLLWTLACMALAWEFFVQPTYQHRFRITFTVATPDGPKSGSAVWSNKCTLPLPGGLSSMTGGCSTVGEAVFVDLGSGKNLVGLMAFGRHAESFDIYEIAARAFAYKDVPVGSNGVLADSYYAYAPHWRGSRELRGNLIPTLITIPDLNDPASIRVVEPTLVNPAFVVAPGYQLSSATLEMVPVGIWPLNRLGIWGTPLSRTIKEKIPFLTTHRQQLWEVTRDPPARYQPSLDQFIRG